MTKEQLDNHIVEYIEKEVQYRVDNLSIAGNTKELIDRIVELVKENEQLKKELKLRGPVFTQSPVQPLTYTVRGDSFIIPQCVHQYDYRGSYKKCVKCGDTVKSERPPPRV